MSQAVVLCTHRMYHHAHQGLPPAAAACPSIYLHESIDESGCCVFYTSACVITNCFSLLLQLLQLLALHLHESLDESG